MANVKPTGKPKGKKRGPKPKINEYYVNPEEFKQELVDYYKCENCTPLLGSMIHKIATGLSYKSNLNEAARNLYKTLRLIKIM